MASMIFSAWRMLASVLPTSEPISEPMSRISVGRFASLPKTFGELRFSAARRREEHHALGTLQRVGVALAAHGTEAERLHRLEAAQAVEPLAAPVELKQAALL